MTVVLTDEQRHAVARRSEPLLLSAAAGSGKTSVLVERFVAAVREDGIAPGKILAITFTERAAGELRARVRARLLALGDREAARDTEAAFVGTFHGFCARLLRAHPLAAGLDPDFAIIDEGLAGRLRELAFKAALREFLAGERTAEVDMLAAYGVDRVRTMVEQIYGELRSQGQRQPTLPVPSPLPAAGESSTRDAADGDGLPEPDGVPEDPQARKDAVATCALLDELLKLYGTAYEDLKQGRGAVDFDDLELLARQLLRERANVRAAWSDRFELLMVDEFQDTNARQLGILEALDRGNLFTVGDELQSIYGFRHADVRLFRERRAMLEEHGGSMLLTRNFRSREPLLDVVNAVFAERFSTYTPLVAGRVDDPGEPEVELLLTNVRGWDERPELAREIAAGLPETQLWRQAEARLLAQRVAELVAQGHTRAGDVVVLLRASGDLEVFERALQLCGLRTLAAVGTFWRHQQIGDLIAYLRALANPLDEDALYAALASPLAGCSKDCLALLAEAARKDRGGAWETALAVSAAGEALAVSAAGEDGGEARAQLALALTPGDRAALASFCARLQAERANASRHTISELIERAIDASGYREHVLGLDWGERRLANVHKLLRLARRFEAREGRELRAFLDHVAYLQDAVKVEPDAPVEGVEPDAVRLMTIHAAKGLEFPVVCLADLGRQPNTQTPDLLVDGERVGVRLVRLDGEGSKAALDYEQLCSERREREAQEEDRILYVAMTRARERLLLSGAVDFERWPVSRQAPTAISWLGPALAADLPALVQAGEKAVHDLPIAGAAGTASVRLRLSTPATMGAVLRRESFAHSPGEPLVSGERALAGTRISSEPDAVESVPVEPAPMQPAPGEQLSFLVGDAPSSMAPASAPTPGTAPAYTPAQASSPAPTAASVPVAAEAPALASLSYTSLSELERCGYRYYLERVLGFGEDRRAMRSEAGHGGLEARARGTLIHRLMESIDFSRPSPPSPQQVGGLARELGMRTSASERDEIAALLDTAMRAQPALRVARARALRREHPFAFSLAPGEPLISGVIDLLAQESDGGEVVLDYKSDRVAATLDLEALVAREYGIQRLLYALAVLRGGAPSVDVVHWFLERPDEAVVARFRAGEREALERRLNEHVASARGRGFAVSASPHRGLCLTCPGRGSLCSWSEQETMKN